MSHTPALPNHLLFSKEPCSLGPGPFPPCLICPGHTSLSPWQTSTPVSAPPRCLPYLDTTSHAVPPCPPAMHSSLTTLTTAVARSAAHLSLLLLKDRTCPFPSISQHLAQHFPPEYANSTYLWEEGVEGGGVEKGRRRGWGRKGNI